MGYDHRVPPLWLDDVSNLYNTLAIIILFFCPSFRQDGRTLFKVRWVVLSVSKLALLVN